MRITFKKIVKIGMTAAALAVGLISASCANNDDQGNNKKYGTPYDRAIGNGNYILHNFISNEDSISRDTVGDDLNHYLGLAKNYMKDKLNAFDKSLNNRESAKQYFSDFIQVLNNDKYYNYYTVYTNNPGDHDCDRAIGFITIESEQYFEDIIRNLNNIEERYAFYIAYRMMANEATHEGQGKWRTATVYQNGYEEEKAELSIYTNGDFLADYHLDQDFDNNYINATNVTDQMLTTAAANIFARQGVDVRAEDLRQIINLNLAAHSLGTAHWITASFWNHKDHCNGALTDENAILTAINKVTYEETGM